VAIVGSVFASAYGPRVVDALSGLPEEVVTAVEESMGAAVVLAGQVPGGEVILVAAQEAFMDGFSAGSLVAAAMTAVGAVLAMAWLPARAKPLATAVG
jgi:hypothetical protein